MLDLQSLMAEGDLTDFILRFVLEIIYNLCASG